MRVCHITTVHPRYDIRIFWRQCVTLAQAGHEVTLLVNDEFGDEINNGVRILSLRHPRRNRIARALSLGVRKEDQVLIRASTSVSFIARYPERSLEKG